MAHERARMDVASYVERSRSGRCFICEFLHGNPDYHHHEVWRDTCCVAFLDKYPTVAGKLLVAPLKHVEHVAAGFTREEYLDLQQRVHWIACVLGQVMPTERMYIYSLGARDGNAHVHWHLAPLPPGVPYEEQQFQALMMENGVLRLSVEEMAACAQRLRAALLEAQ